MNSLIFDCDGVLAETERDGHLVAFNEMFRRVGLRVHWNEQDYSRVLQVAGGKERLRALCTAEFLADNNLPTDPASLDAEIAQWHKLKTDIFLDLAAGDGIPARTGVRRIAEQALAQGWRIGVASTSTPVAVRAIAAKALGEGVLAEGVIVAGDMVPRKKPAPDVYLKAMETLGVEPAQSVAVEDSRIGVTAAVRAGMAVIATKSHFTQDEDLSDAHIIVNELGEPGGAALEIGSNLTAAQIHDHISIYHAAECIEARSSLQTLRL